MTKRERDAARAELAALRARIEALCDEAEKRKVVDWGGFVNVHRVRAALADPAEDPT